MVRRRHYSFFPGIQVKTTVRWARNFSKVLKKRRGWTNQDLKITRRELRQETTLKCALGNNRCLHNKKKQRGCPLKNQRAACSQIEEMLSINRRAARSEIKEAPLFQRPVISSYLYIFYIKFTCLFLVSSLYF